MHGRQVEEECCAAVFNPCGEIGEVSIGFAVPTLEVDEYELVCGGMGGESGCVGKVSAECAVEVDCRYGYIWNGGFVFVEDVDAGLVLDGFCFARCECQFDLARTFDTTGIDFAGRQVCDAGGYCYLFVCVEKVLSVVCGDAKGECAR